MNKEKFNSLSIGEQVQEVNRLVCAEGSLRKACDRLTLSRSTIRDRFKKYNYEFCKTCNSYVIINEHSCNTNAIQEKNSNKLTWEHRENTSVLLNEDMKKKFAWMMNNFDILECIIKERIHNEYNCNTSIVEVKSTEFVIDLPEAPNHHTTIRINKEIWDEFNELYNNKYKHLNKIDVLSMAIKQFNDKHK